MGTFNVRFVIPVTLDRLNIKIKPQVHLFCIYLCKVIQWKSKGRPQDIYFHEALFPESCFIRTVHNLIKDRSGTI